MSACSLHERLCSGVPWFCSNVVGKRSDCVQGVQGSVQKDRYIGLNLKLRSREGIDGKFREKSEFGYFDPTGALSQIQLALRVAF